MPKADTGCASGALPVPGGWVPEWPVPAHVHAFMTTRTGGVSAPPFDSFNLGSHVRDDVSAVARNRQLLAQHVHARPVFLNQVHGNVCAPLTLNTPDETVADACITQTPGVACTVMVADCLPVLLADTAGRTVAAAHAGWRGLAGVNGDGGVLAQVLKLFCASSHDPCENNATDFLGQVAATSLSALAANGQLGAADLVAWLGPCIGPGAFEVGKDVRAAFTAHAAIPAETASCFQPVPGRPGKYLCDLARLARLQLASLGVTRVYGNDGSARWCTVSQPDTWFSHRRDANALGSTGRMAACVWLAPVHGDQACA
jgi:copper oxidase (laccase) domain-containing protein